MAALTAPFDVPLKEGHEIRIASAAIKCYRGGAAAVVLGTGTATPLVPATVGHQFIGVYEETIDNSLAGAPGYVRVRREGIFAFNQSGITAPSVGQRAYFSDDNTVTTTVGNQFAGTIVAIDEANALAWVDIGVAVLGQMGMIALAASGAILPSVQANYVLTKAGVAAMTLAAPVAATDDGKIITITSDTANAHTITCPAGVFKNGGAAVTIFTFTGTTSGGGLTLEAYNATWKVLAATGGAFS